MAITRAELVSGKVLFNRVLVEVKRPEETVSKGGIILPAGEAKGEANLSDAVEGTIVNIGPGVQYKKAFVPTTRRRGDRILFAQHSGEKVPVHLGTDGGCDYFIIYEDEIIGLVEGDGEIKTVENEAA